MMTPFAIFLLNQHVSSVLQQRAVLGKQPVLADPKSMRVASPPSLRPISGSGVYFNDREVPQEMHISCSSRITPYRSRLPFGKPMPQPPKLIATLAQAEGHPIESDGGASSSQKRENCNSLKLDDRVIKRQKIISDGANLSRDQRAFLEAALALSAVRSTEARKPPTTSSKIVLEAALPPPPFSLFSNFDLPKQPKPKMVKSA